MANVSEDVLRIIGTNRTWVKNYGVILGAGAEPEDAAGDVDAVPAPPERTRPEDAGDRSERPRALRLAARKVIVKSRLQ